MIALDYTIESPQERNELVKKILEENPEIDEILPVMDKIQRYSRILEELEENYDEGFDSYGSGS